jgi:hypothetical protein
MPEGPARDATADEEYRTPSVLGRRPSGPDCLTSNSGRTVTRRRFVEIRSALARGERVGALAEDYGVHKSMISRIKHGVRRRSS